MYASTYDCMFADVYIQHPSDYLRQGSNYFDVTISALFIALFCLRVTTPTVTANHSNSGAKTQIYITLWALLPMVVIMMGGLWYETRLQQRFVQSDLVPRKHELEVLQKKLADSDAE